MSRSKKGAFNSLIWRLNNAKKAPPLDDEETGFEDFESFDDAITDRVMRCLTCGSQRVEVPASEVPPEVRATLERSTKITQFIYCPTCKAHSGLGDWSSF